MNKEIHLSFTEYNSTFSSVGSNSIVLIHHLKIYEKPGVYESIARFRFGLLTWFKDPNRLKFELPDSSETSFLKSAELFGDEKEK